MNLPVQITFRHMDSSPQLEARIREEAGALDRYFGRITSCHVVVEGPGKPGRGFEVNIDIGVPGTEIAVNHQPSSHNTLVHSETNGSTKNHDLQPDHKDVYVAIRDAFLAARRQVEDYAEKLRGDVKKRQKEKLEEVN